MSWYEWSSQRMWVVLQKRREVYMGRGQGGEANQAEAGERVAEGSQLRWPEAPPGARTCAPWHLPAAVGFWLRFARCSATVLS